MVEPVSTALGVGLVGGLMWRKIKRQNKQEARTEETFQRQREIDDRAEGQKRMKNFLMYMVNGVDVSAQSKSDPHLQRLLESQGYGQVTMATAQDVAAGAVTPGSIWFHPTAERIANGEGPLALSREKQSRLLVDLGFKPQTIQVGQMLAGPGGVLNAGSIDLGHSNRVWSGGQSQSLAKSQVGRFKTAKGVGIFDTTKGSLEVQPAMVEARREEAAAAAKKKGGSSGQNYQRASDIIRNIVKMDPMRLTSTNQPGNTLAAYGARAQRILAGIADDIGYENARLVGEGSRLGAAAMEGYSKDVSFDVAFDNWKEQVTGTKTVGRAVAPARGGGLDPSAAPPVDLSTYQSILGTVLNKVRAGTDF